jgi:hypothetical protein
MKLTLHPGLFCRYSAAYRLLLAGLLLGVTTAGGTLHAIAGFRIALSPQSQFGSAFRRRTLRFGCRRDEGGRRIASADPFLPRQMTLADQIEVQDFRHAVQLAQNLSDVIPDPGPEKSVLAGVDEQIVDPFENRLRAFAADRKNLRQLVETLIDSPDHFATGK